LISAPPAAFLDVSTEEMPAGGQSTSGPDPPRKAAGIALDERDGDPATPGEPLAGGGEIFAAVGRLSVRGGELSAEGGESFARGGEVSARSGGCSAGGGEPFARSGGLSAAGGGCPAGAGESSAAGGEAFAGSGEVSARVNKGFARENVAGSDPATASIALARIWTTIATVSATIAVLAEPLLRPSARHDTSLGSPIPVPARRGNTYSIDVEVDHDS
jgi:hypothetical protein